MANESTLSAPGRNAYLLSHRELIELRPKISALSADAVSEVLVACAEAIRLGDLPLLQAHLAPGLKFRTPQFRGDILEAAVLNCDAYCLRMSEWFALYDTADYTLALDRILSADADTAIAEVLSGPIPMPLAKVVGRIAKETVRFGRCLGRPVVSEVVVHELAI